MAEITKEQWDAAFKKVHDEYAELRRYSVMNHNQLDRLEHLRHIVNAYGKNIRTQRLYNEMVKV